MGFVDHLKGINPEQLFLEVATGYHDVSGDLAKSIVTGTSPTHVVQVQQLLGDAYGKGWSGPRGVWFRGTNRPSSKYTFHPGIQTPDPVDKTYTASSATDVITSTAHGFNDGDMIIFRPGDNPAPLVAGTIYYVRDKTTNTFKVTATSGGTAIDLTTNGAGALKVYLNHPTQGIDTIFSSDIPHSNTAWIRVEAPNGSEVGIPDFDTKNNPPTGLKSIMGCQLGDIYNNVGTVTSSGVLLLNPADVLAFGCKEIWQCPNSRIDWAALDTLRSASVASVTPDYTTLPQGVGLTGSYYDGSAFNTFKTKRVDPVIQYDLSTGAPELGLTPTGFSVRFEGKIRFKYTETYTLTLIHNDSGKLWINNLAGGAEIINQASAGTHTGTFAATADTWYDIKMEWTNAASDSQFTFQWNSTSQPLQVVPQDRLYPKAEAIPKFETHIKFTERTSFDDFLRAVLTTCNGSMQDVNGKLVFFTLDGATPSFDFDESNIVKNSFKLYPRYTQDELRNLPNRFISDGRDLDSRYLEPFDPPLYYDVADLQDIAGRVIEQTVNIGNCRRWQGLLNLADYAKRRTAQLVAEFEGMPQTLKVLPGDVVRVTHSIPNWTNQQMLCVEATDKSTGKAADNRLFKLYSWS